MKVWLMDFMGSDLTVANAARVSFNNHSPDFSDGDEKLIKYLAKHNHWTPFAHCTLQFRIKAPIFVARQLVKHQVGLVWNEVSRRYIKDEPEYYMPDEWRKNPENAKQGSSETEVLTHDASGSLVNANFFASDVSRLAIKRYKELMSLGVCAEQARMILPLNTFTEWYWTGSLYAFSRVCNLRCAKDTQKETRQIAEQISHFSREHFPVSWKYLIHQGAATNESV